MTAEIERWEVEWEYEGAAYVFYPLHRTFSAALREVQKIGSRNDAYGMKLEQVIIKRVMVPRYGCSKPQPKYSFKFDAQTRRVPGKGPR